MSKFVALKRPVMGHPPSGGDTIFVNPDHVTHVSVGAEVGQSIIFLATGKNYTVEGSAREVAQALEG